MEIDIITIKPTQGKRGEIKHNQTIGRREVRTREKMIEKTC